ncbi:alkylated DNA repair [Paraconexibacter sp. AEG42_29]|uniref:Alkylated DNA repair n=1 Tax=Paraconexibacter sp. AEG42_29 TaxID=2997339 RepID=A0AAU7AP01_9ACTN
MPRWQQAYVRDYAFSGRVSAALDLPPVLQPFVSWSRDVIDPRLNGVLVNWYASPGDEIDDGETSSAGDYIGPHRDSRDGLIVGAPIVTISLGGLRTFRLRPYREKGPAVDVPLHNGAVVVVPFDTNLAYTHEVPRPRSTKGEVGRRISITLRAFTRLPGAST